MGDCYIVRRGGSGGSYGKIPKFTYTGAYRLVDDGDGNWRIKFLTSGTLTFTKSVGNIDVFLVGGGGCGASGAGGGGGYTTTATNVVVMADTEYPIVIGAGGTNGGDGGTSSAFNANASGGKCTGSSMNGGDGGSGGGSGAPGLSDMDNIGGDGGSDGSSGYSGYYAYKVGSGQGTTTREFGEEDGDIYAGGGGGWGWTEGRGGAGGGGNGRGSEGETNTGGGGGSNSDKGADYGAAGGSGIVVIRNARRTA